MTRLRRVSVQSPGWTRRRRGKGFSYLDLEQQPLPTDDCDRIKALAIPPAWADVWICPAPNGHVQAVGTDDAGRRQYLYHPQWREKQDLLKHERVLTVGARLPHVRAKICAQLKSPGPDRPTVLALAVRLMDLGCFRIGSETYADSNGSYGLTTLELRHVDREREKVSFCFEAKSSIEQEIQLNDPAIAATVACIDRRRDPSAPLLAWREGRRWHDLGAVELNEYIHDLFGLEATAKDFRTWHATVIVAAALAGEEPDPNDRKRRRQVKDAIAEAADVLGNTPTITENSYVNPRVIELFEEGQTIRGIPASWDGSQRGQDRLDRQVSRLLK